MLIPKKPPVRDRKHLDFVKTLPCIICGYIPCDPAHIRILGDGGMGMKPSDSRVVSLCRPHHDEQHRTNEVKFYYDYGGHEFAVNLAKKLHENTGDWDECVRLIRLWREKAWNLL